MWFDRHIFPASSTPLSSGGFTLLELLIVITILVAAAALIYPRFFEVQGARLRSDARKLSTLIRFLDEAAATRKLYYRLWFEFGKDRLRVEVSKDGSDYALYPDNRIRFFSFADGVDLKDVSLPGLGRVAGGEVAVIFSPLGAGEPFTVHLSGGGDDVTVDFNPYSGRVRVKEGYV